LGHFLLYEYLCQGSKEYGSGDTNVISHEFETASPVADVEVCVAEPGISVVSATAPFCFGHVVIEVHVDLLLCELGGDGVVDLLFRKPIYTYNILNCQHTCSLVVEAPNWGLFLINFAYTASPLLPNAFWNDF
jgi:hypothetical protein